MSKRGELLDSLEESYREFAGSNEMYRNARADAERDLGAYRAEVLREVADALHEMGEATFDDLVRAVKETRGKYCGDVDENEFDKGLDGAEIFVRRMAEGGEAP